MSGDMSFMFVIEAVDRATAVLDKVGKAEKAVEAATKANNAAVAAGAQKAEAAIQAEAKAIDKSSIAMKMSAAAAKARGEAMAASAEMAAAAAAKQAHEAERAESVFGRLKSVVTISIDHITSALHRSTAATKAQKNAFVDMETASHRSASVIARDFGRAGLLAGKLFAKNVSTQIRTELPAALRAHADKGFEKLFGFEMAHGKGALRTNTEVVSMVAMDKAKQGFASASAMAMSNVENQLALINQLKPDLGDDKAHALLAAANDSMPKSAFRRDAIRATLPDAASIHLMPGSSEWQALMDAAASQQKTPAEAVAALKAAKAGDFSQLKDMFGIDAAMGDDGSVAKLLYKANGSKMASDVHGADLSEKISAALGARFGGGEADKAATLDGMITKAANAWDLFVGKIMDAGPYDYMKSRLAAAMAFFDGKDIDAKAHHIADQIVNVMTAIEGAVTRIYPWIERATQLVGGLENALVVLFTGVVLSRTAAFVAPFVQMATALTAVSWPMIAVVAGVTALAAAGFLLYQNWDRVGPALARAFNAMKSAAAEALAAVTATLANWGSEALGAIKAAFQPVVDWFSNAVEGVKSLWGGVKTAMTSAAAFVGVGDPGAAKNAQALEDAGRAREALDLISALERKLGEVQAAVAAFDLAGPISGALGAARAAVAGVSFYAEGVAMMTTLAEGIRAGSAHAVEAVHAVAQQMRDHLPHSPAKVGPLSDLDRVRFSETLALAIRPDPAVEAVHAVAASMAGAIVSPKIGILADAGGPSGGGGARGGGGGPVSVTYAPTIHVKGDAASFAEQARAHAYELADIINRETRNRDRLAFGDA